jgi:DHA1 family tetracycline resistance protein-like MFS transporter
VLTLRRSFLVAVLGFVAFVTSFGAHVVAVNLPVYAKQVGVGLTAIGVLIAIYDFAEIVAKPVFGWIGDRNGIKATMLVGIAFFSLASVSYLFVTPRLLVLVRFLQGLGAAALSITSAALVAEYFPQDRGKAFGIYNALKGAGYVLGPVIGGFIVWKSNFAMIFLASAAAWALAFLLSLLLPSAATKTPLDDNDDFSLRLFLRAAFRERDLLRRYVVIVVNMFMVGILFGFLPVYVNALGYDQLKNGFIVAASTASYLLIQPIAGLLADRFSPTQVTLAGLALSAIAIVLVPSATGALLLSVAILGGAGVGTVWTNTDTVVSNLAKGGRLAATLGAAGSFKELGDMLGPLMIGWVSQFMRLKVGFVACGALGLGAIALLRLLVRPTY